MEKRFSLTICIILLVACSLYAQGTADSLVGSYAGQCHNKALSSDPWTIIQDTIIVWGTPVASFIDTGNCKVRLNGCNWSQATSISFYSSYSHCNSVITGNYYAWFHDMDSLTAIADSFTMSPFSNRFYGKRINNHLGLSVNEMKYNKPELLVYPNPSNTILFIEYKMFNGVIPVQITDVTGKEIKTVQMSNSKMQTDISSLANGTYFVNLKTDKGIIAEKIVVHR